MIETSLQIANLMSSDYMSASEITHSLKIIGNGNMQQGIKKISKYFSIEIQNAYTQGFITGRRQGCLICLAGALIISGLSLYATAKKRKAKDQADEGYEILYVMKKCSSKNTATSGDTDSTYITECNPHEEADTITPSDTKTL